MAQRYWGVYLAIRDKTELDESQFNQFVSHVRWEIRMKSRVYGTSISENDQTELVQHAVAEVVKGIRSAHFDPQQNTFKNWVDGLIRNVLRNFVRFRSSPRGQTQSLEELTETHLMASGEQWIPEVQAIQHEDLVLCQRALRTLKQEYPRYYQVLWCRCFHELSTEETAKFLNESSPNVSRQLNRARTKLRELLEIEGGIGHGRA